MCQSCCSPCRLQTSDCVDQYQSTSLRVFTHFVAAEEEVEEGPEEANGPGSEQQEFLLGGHWQLEVTHLVQDSLRVEDPGLAKLEGRILVGVAPGITRLQVGITAECNHLKGGV